MASSIIKSALQSRPYSGHPSSFMSAAPLATIAPILLIVLVGFLFFKIFFGDSGTYSSYARSIGSTAANIWDENRKEFIPAPGNQRDSRRITFLEPLMVEVLDALSMAVKKYEQPPQHKKTGTPRNSIQPNIRLSSNGFKSK